MAIILNNVVPKLFNINSKKIKLISHVKLGMILYYQDSRMSAVAADKCLTTNDVMNRKRQSKAVRWLSWGLSRIKQSWQTGSCSSSPHVFPASTLLFTPTPTPTPTLAEKEEKKSCALKGTANSHQNSSRQRKRCLSLSIISASQCVVHKHSYNNNNNNNSGGPHRPLSNSNPNPNPNQHSSSLVLLPLPLPFPFP